MATFEKFGRFDQLVVDSRNQLALAMLSPCAFKYSPRRFNKATSGLPPELFGINWPGHNRFGAGAWEVNVVDNRDIFVYRVATQEENGEILPVFLPDDAAGTAKEIAQAIAGALDNSDANISEKDDVFTFELSGGTELLWSISFIPECLKHLEFQVHDGTTLKNLVLVPSETFVAPSRNVVHKFKS